MSARQHSGRMEWTKQGEQLQSCSMALKTEGFCTNGNRGYHFANKHVPMRTSWQSTSRSLLFNFYTGR